MFLHLLHRFLATTDASRSGLIAHWMGSLGSGLTWRVAEDPEAFAVRLRWLFERAWCEKRGVDGAAKFAGGAVGVGVGVATPG